MNYRQNSQEPFAALPHSVAKPYNAAFRSEARASAAFTSDREMRGRDYLRALRRHIGMISILVTVVTIPVAVVLMVRPDYYDARAQIEIRSSATAKSGADSGYAPPNPAEFNTQLQFLSSPALLRQVVDKLHLEHDQVFLRHLSVSGRLVRRLLRLTYFGNRDIEASGTPLTADLPSSVTAEELAATKRISPYVQDLAARLTAVPVMETRAVLKETSLVDITFRHPNPQLAAKVVNAIADIFVSDRHSLNDHSHLRTQEYLTHRAAELREQIQIDEGRLSSFGDAHQLLPLQTGQDIAVERLANLNRQLLEAENDRKIAEANYETALAPDAARTIAEENTRTVLNEATLKLADLRGKRAQLLVGATESWPEVKEVDQQILSLQQDIKNIQAGAVDSARESLETKFRQAKAREGSLLAAFEKQKALVQSQNRAAGDGRLIRQQIETNQTLLTETMKRLGEMDGGELSRTGEDRVVEYSTIPDPNEPAGPWRLPFIGAAFLLSLVSGCLGALIWESFDQKLRSTEDVEAVLSVTPIAMIRTSAPSKRQLPTQTTAMELSKAGWLATPELLLSSACDPEFVEDYRRLRTSLLFSTGYRAPKTILLTSSTSGEGATTNAVNVAVSLAQNGAKVLIVDANFRAPRIHSLFRISNKFGLSSLLSDEADLNPVEWIVRDLNTGVYVLAAGPGSGRSAELLGSPRMLRLLRRLESQFEHVILDAPAIGSAADSLVLAPAVDAVLLVVHAANTPRELVRQSHHLLERVRTRLVYIVLNQAPRRSAALVAASALEVRV